MKPPKRVRYPRGVAVHEAGHVVAMCHFTCGIRGAYVKARGLRKLVDKHGDVWEGSAGVAISGAGFSHQDAFKSLEVMASHFASPETRNTIASHGIQAIVAGLAGPLADERHQRKALTWGCYEDWEKAFGVARFLHPANPEGLLAWAEQFTQAFLDEPGMWERVIAVADVLTADGYMDGHHPVLAGIERRTISWRLPRRLPTFTRETLREWRTQS